MSPVFPDCTDCISATANPIRPTQPLWAGYVGAVTTGEQGRGIGNEVAATGWRGRRWVARAGGRLVGGAEGDLGGGPGRGPVGRRAAVPRARRAVGRGVGR